MATVAVVSDTHLPRGSRRLPELCLERLRTADLILHCGDFSALSALEELRSLGPPLKGVHGNADEPALRVLLPEILVVEVAGALIGMVHDPGAPAGRAERLADRFPGCECVVYGHTHLPVVERHGVEQHGAVWLLNPGSPTERRRGRFHSLVVLEIADGEIRPELVHLT